MSIKDNFPSVGPSLSLNFARSKTLDPRITFARPSTSGDATYMNENGLIVTAAADEPRFDHKYENGVVKSLGLLVEEQRVNYCVNSTGSGNWSSPNGLTKSASKTVTAPTGETDAYEWTETTASGTHLNNGPTITISSGSSYSISAFFKQVSGSGRGFLLQWYKSGGQTVKVSYVPSTDTTYISNSGGASAPTNVSVVTYPNGWYKISFTAALAETSALSIVGSTDGSGNASYTGSTSNSFSFWGLQYEQASFPTSYIPTSGSEATRSPDNVSMTGTNFSDWYNTTEGTIFVDCTPVYSSPTNQYKRLLSIHNNSGSQTDVIQLIQYEQSNVVQFAVWDGSSPQALFSKSSFTSGTRFKVAFAVKENNMNASYDGNIGTDDTTCTLPAMTQMDIGKYTTNSDTQTTVHINNISYYPKRLTNTQLQNLTK